jgi:hypothetical protein
MVLQVTGPSYNVVDPDLELYGQVGSGVFGVTVQDMTLMRIRILLLKIMRIHATLITESVQAPYYSSAVLRIRIPDPKPIFLRA